MCSVLQTLLPVTNRLAKQLWLRPQGGRRTRSHRLLSVCREKPPLEVADTTYEKALLFLCTMVGLASGCAVSWGLAHVFVFEVQS